MTDDLFYRKLESTPTIDLVDMIRDKDKCIAELEKSCDETQELLDKQIEATYKLDKENAELKKGLRDANEKVVHLACNQNKDLKYKLTKAKFLLKQLVDAFPKSYSDVVKDTLKQAEQFIKDSEVEK